MFFWIAGTRVTDDEVRQMLNSTPPRNSTVWLSGMYFYWLYRSVEPREIRIAGDCPAGDQHSPTIGFGSLTFPFAVETNYIGPIRDASV